MDSSACIYVVLDLETTGLYRATNHIIELAGEILDRDGGPIEDATYESLVKPPIKIPSTVTDLTGITNEMVKEAPEFPVVMKEFVDFIVDHREQYQDVMKKPIPSTILVAHNGKRFDIPFLVDACNKNDIGEIFVEKEIHFACDTLVLAREMVRERKLKEVPQSFRLVDLYEFCCANPMGTAHRAMADVKATSVVLRHPPFWKERLEHMWTFVKKTWIPEIISIDDSDDDVSSESNDSLDVEEDESEEIEAEVVSSEESTTQEVAQGWKLNTVFDGTDVNQKFVEYFAKPGTRGKVDNNSGVQCAVSSCNSPTKDWRQIFAHAL
ncbi:MAG: 3'-5' exonuclease, partial [Bacteroidota bacterium]